MNNVMLSLTISLLFGIGTFLILRREMMKVIIGFGIVSHAINLYIVASGVFSEGTLVPILEHHQAVEGLGQGLIVADDVAAGVIGPITTNPFTEFVDPLVQALVLTAIVIGLATTAFILTLAYRIYEEYGTTDVQELRRLWG
ncbi:Na(+) H(+) antiporter subunit C [Methanosarcina sp. MTP4]|uniref:NADH-quinone oxidoreductase subunit K n=1 Tax=Methanosarcina sp. MTP4 TaxID=1434100 RepID=UPI000615A8C4|nr:NADH-quinone oxidoreductase subunit K [Methanosarcina sp. MTP4]AKB23545.1 Na(+) H(+) antiporter subunit C [Methanosarcina sp. MTP4]